MSDLSQTQKPLDPLVDYADYVREEISLGYSVDRILDFDEFTEMRKTLSDKESLLKFVNPGALGKAVAGVAALGRTPIGQQIYDAGVAGVSKTGQEIADQISQRLASGEPFVKVKKMFGGTGGNSGGKVGGDGSSGNPFNPNRMNFNPKPVQVRLDTGIRSKGYGDYWPESKPHINVLEITQVELRVPTSSGSKLKTYFDNVVAFNFQNDAQMKVSFNVDAINNFSEANLRAWLNRYSRAYAVYVWLTSIINYCNEPLQANEGMRALRQMITPTLMDDLSQLANMLDGTPAPPKFREFVHFIFGAPFQVGNNPGAQLRMISPCALQSALVGTESQLTQLPGNLVTDLITDLYNMRATTALIAKVCPEWIPGMGNTPSGATVPENSPNWHTLWENLPFYVSIAGTDYYGPGAANEDEDVIYGSTADILDGAITGLFNAYDTSSALTNPLDRFKPGTMIPIWSQNPSAAPHQTAYSNRISYRFLEGFGPYFRLVNEGTNQGNYMRSETHTVTTNGVDHGIIWPGRENINNINIATARQTSYEFYSKVFFMGKTGNKSFDRSKSTKRSRRSKKKDASEEE